jgi:O-acetyl-ADP-ribose deacetylase (regulator of RNase III)
MTQLRHYQVGASRLTVQFGDLLSSRAEVIVSSDDYMLSMGGGVSKAIAAQAGTALILDATKCGPRRLGDVVVTTAGALPARYVFHVVTIGPPPEGRGNSEPEMVDIVSRATKHCLVLLTPLGVSSIAFPALGTGAASVSMEDAASAMATAILPFLTGISSAIQVELWLKPRRGITEMDYIVFFEEFARRVPSIAKHDVQRQIQLEQDRARIERELSEAQATRSAHDIDALSRNLQDNALRRAVAYEANRRERSPVTVFVSYAHEDEKYAQLLLEAMSGLRLEGLVRAWHDRRIMPGSDWQVDIETAIEETDMMLLIVSSSFLNSPYCTGVELGRALQLHDDRKLIVVPIIARPSDWRPLLGRFQALPKDGKPISSYSDLDEANLNVVLGLRQLIEMSRQP